MKDIHIPRVLMCDQCDYTASKEEHLKKHIKFIHDGSCYKCDERDFASNVLLHWQTITIVLIKVFFTNVINVTTSVATGQTLRSTI